MNPLNSVIIEGNISKLYLYDENPFFVLTSCRMFKRDEQFTTECINVSVSVPKRLLEIMVEDLVVARALRIVGALSIVDEGIGVKAEHIEKLCSKTMPAQPAKQETKVTTAETITIKEFTQVDLF